MEMEIYILTLDISLLCLAERGWSTILRPPGLGRCEPSGFRGSMFWLKGSSYNIA
jgi:hypothetical protein